MPGISGYPLGIQGQCIGTKAREARSFDKAQEAELDELLNVRVPENQRAIGEAAAHGDLSENAEYTAALEERDQLMRRAGRVRSEVESAREKVVQAVLRLEAAGEVFIPGRGPEENRLLY